ncbi:FeoA family protein [Flexibacterium corallicola]|uniref:FeoA family protein n=1 Tax=Flexibacterium corallicola TaxID=3037259 RepID=UPI00286F9EF1|nr:FeoA family protein [Pseudovibrio sp. M1P-2-3]
MDEKTQRTSLDQVPSGQNCSVFNLAPYVSQSGKELHTRLNALGIINGKKLKVITAAKLGGPLIVRVGSSTQVAIRRSEASRILVVRK